MTNYERLFAIKCAKYEREQLTAELIDILAEEALRECNAAEGTLHDAERKRNAEKIAEHYGQKKQDVQATQELAELILELTRRDDQRGSDYVERLTDEIADVEIMCEQLFHLHNITEDELYSRIDYKLNRQLERIKGELI